MGGQAVLEGVMMRGPRKYAVAVRRPQGDIRLISRPFWPVTNRSAWLRLPVVRGTVSLIEMLALGFKSLDYSANVADQACREMEGKEKESGVRSQESEVRSQESEDRSQNPGVRSQERGNAEADHEDNDPQTENCKLQTANCKLQTVNSKPETRNPKHAPEERSISVWTMTAMFALSLGIGMLLFVALPNAATHFLGWASGRSLVEENRPLLYNLIAGLVRVCVIVGYVWAISLLKDVRRLFQYHGAEHKVVMAFEKRLPLDLEHVRPVTTVHPRCGTTFIAVVILVSILVFAMLAALIVVVYPPFTNWSLWVRKPIIILLHVLFMPLVAGVAYEITRRAGRKPHLWPYRMLLAPGMAFQRITTRPPDDSMIEVALEAFFEALEPEQRAQIPALDSAAEARPAS